MSVGTSRDRFGEELGRTLHVFGREDTRADVGFFMKCLVRVCPRSPSGSSLTHSFPLGLVKAINTAVDLIVAHFGTSRDPGVKVRLAFSMASQHHA